MEIIRILILLLVSGFIGLLSIPIMLLGFNLDLPAALLAASAIALLIVSVRAITFAWKRLYRFDPYREERQYIKHQLKEARKQLKTVGYCRLKVRSFTLWIKISRLYKLAKGIVKIVEDEPDRYKDVQAFFTQYLPSTVTLVDRYTFLIKQPVTSNELKESLRETENLLDEMADKYSCLLLNTLSNDVLSLNIERRMLEKSFRENK